MRTRLCALAVAVPVGCGVGLLATPAGATTPPPLLFRQVVSALRHLPAQ